MLKMDPLKIDEIVPESFALVREAAKAFWGKGIMMSNCWRFNFA